MAYDDFSNLGDFSTSSLDLSGIGDYSGTTNFSDYQNFSPFGDSDGGSQDFSSLFGSGLLSGVGDYSGFDNYSNLVDSFGQSNDLSSIDLGSLGTLDLGNPDAFGTQGDLYFSGDGNYGFGDMPTIDLSNSNYNTDGLLRSAGGAGQSGETSGDGMSKLLGSISKLLGGGGSGSPQLSGLLNALLAVMAQRKGISNGNKSIQQAQNTAAQGSQRSLGGIRGGLSNLNTAARDPMSYVQAAPPIVRQEQ